MFVTTCNCNMKHKYISLIKAIKGLKDVDLRKKKRCRSWKPNCGRNAPNI